MPEKTEKIGAIGEWVLRTACTQMDSWYRRGLPRIAISVNVSSRQFRQDSLANTVKAVLDETHFDPKLLELELTESLLMDDIERSRTILAELKSRSEEHTSELQSQSNLVCRLLLEKQ